MTYAIGINPDTKDDNYPDECYIDVIGNDGKMHVALSWEKKAICGTPIYKKNPHNDNKRTFSCYECTY